MEVRSRPEVKAKRDMTLPEFKKSLEILMGSLTGSLATATHKLCGCSSIISAVEMTFATWRRTILGAS
jgi:hypothetical protein